MEVKGQWGLLLPPGLLITEVQQPGTSSPPSWLKRSSEGIILDVHGLLHQQLLSSAMVLHCGFLQVDRLVVLSACSAAAPLAGILVFLQSHLQSPSGLFDLDLPQLQVYDIPHWFAYQEVAYSANYQTVPIIERKNTEKFHADSE